MAYRSIMLILLLVLNSNLRRTASKSIQRICQTHRDCSRPLQLCDKGYCRGIRTIAEMEEVLKIKECTNFKAACKSDVDCSCSQISMICESNECVVRTNSNVSQR